MRLLTILFLSLLWMTDSKAQEFATHWISYPLPNDSSEVWFRKGYTLQQRPRQAYLSIASTGSYKLYVNERNVAGSTKFDGLKGDTLLLRTFDVTNYLKTGENIIAAWYAPQGRQSQGRQLSVDFYGYSTSYAPFHHQSDGTWLTLQLNSCSSGEAETYDGNTDDQTWKSEEYEPQGWLAPTGSIATALPLPSQEHIVCQAENKLVNILKPVTLYTDSMGYHVDFGRHFHGTIRLTIREAHKGDLLHINGYRYICNGELDEQAFFRFKYQDQRIYTLTWSNKFRKNNIVNIEGLEILE